MTRPSYVNNKNKDTDAVLIPTFGVVSGIEILEKDSRSLMEKFISTMEGKQEKEG